jgi:hypothetical protein
MITNCRNLATKIIVDDQRSGQYLDNAATDKRCHNQKILAIAPDFSDQLILD